ncbi:MAG: hypothetical protein LBJ59_07820, partial [Zoogloeaceae bacterium]|nr:hypothetical protein [Zoogloeaceae bacterium]
SDLWFSRNGNTLTVDLLNSADSISFEYWFLGETYHVEEFKLSDGTVLQHTQVQTLVEAMANHEAPTGTTEAGYPEDLLQLIGSVWETPDGGL